MQLKILIVDDHPLIRAGLANVIREVAAEVIVIEAGDAATATAALAEHADARLILLDLMVPGADGFSLLYALRAARPDVPVVVLSANDARSQVLAAIDGGAMGFISKRSNTAILVSALRVVLAGGVYVPPQVLLSEPGVSPTDFGPPAVRTAAKGAAITPAHLGLTDRQADVLALLVQGKPNKVICRELDLAEGTVKTHITAILRTLNATNRTEALFVLSRHGVHLPPLAVTARRHSQGEALAMPLAK